MRLTLATQNGRAVTKLSKVRRDAARPDIEIARLRRCLASIRMEAEKAQIRAKAAEELMSVVHDIARAGDPVLTLAMIRHAIIETANAHRVGLVVRYCEMAEEGTLCA